MYIHFTSHYFTSLLIFTRLEHEHELHYQTSIIFNPNSGASEQRFNFTNIPTQQNQTKARTNSTKHNIT